MRTSVSNPSVHSWATAIDINVAWNGYGAAPAAMAFGPSERSLDHRVLWSLSLGAAVFAPPILAIAPTGMSLGFIAVAGIPLIGAVVVLWIIAFARWPAAPRLVQRRDPVSTDLRPSPRRR